MSRAAVFDELGGPEVLRIGDVTLGEPGPDEVGVRIEAVSINRSDQMLRTGAFIYQPALPGARIGSEAAGQIDAVGSAVGELALGDHVLCAAIPQIDRDGVCAERVILPAKLLVRRPAGDPVTAAALWLAYTTAYGGLVETGGLQRGDHVVITAASSSVGHAAIQIANHVGAVPIATTRSPARRDELLAAGAAHVIDTDVRDVGDAVRALTDGEGAAVVFDAVAGPGLSRVAAATRRGGTLVVYGLLDLRPAPLPTNWPLRIFGYDNAQTTMDPVLRRRAARFIFDGVRAGALAPRVDRTFAFDDVVAAHRHFESKRPAGKVVITLDR